ncbi:Mhp366/Mhp367 family surface (lipo)protein [Mesomycoplasma flocculare]|uniref:Lipoprotein n=1 Tax=Mesomycoplasma flocculare ATCC 27399 TaxID=743971 RepID=A0A0A8E719_MESFC|nr:hypothetical protein [Mesomycoplasma flocculare]AJC49808.1 lipoprotein [Mesomycoplasma flocculare ATCC 27399]
MKKIAKYFLVLSTMSPFLALSCTSRIETSQTKKNTTEIKNEETAKNENKLGLAEGPKVSTVEKNNQKLDLINSENKAEKTENKSANNHFKPESANNSTEEASFDFAKVNKNSLKIDTDALEKVSESDFSKNEAKNVVKTPTYFQYQLKNWENVVKKENENAFLGQKNENLNIYLLKKISANLIDNIEAKKNYFSYFNPHKVSNYYNLPWFGFKSDQPEDTRYADIFTRNIRFAAGTAVFLNANSEKAAFLTNKHVIGDSTFPFWKLMNKKVYTNQLNAKLIKFMQYYDEFKFKELDNRILFRLWESKWLYDNKKLMNNSARLKIPELDSYMKNLYANYFKEKKDFENFGLDVGIFYFNYAKFIKDVEDLIAYYKSKKEFLNSIQSLKDGKFENFVADFNEFKKYWGKISKFEPLKISDKSWESEDFDYTTKIGLFWAQNFTSKNVFKGINFRTDSENPKLIAANFFATNGPGASGSGIFNADGSLAFINRTILTTDGKAYSLFYDQFGLTSHMTSGIALKTRNYNLVDEIYKAYLE